MMFEEPEKTEEPENTRMPKNPKTHTWLKQHDVKKTFCVHLSCHDRLPVRLQVSYVCERVWHPTLLFILLMAGLIGEHMSDSDHDDDDSEDCEDDAEDGWDYDNDGEDGKDDVDHEADDGNEDDEDGDE